VTRHVATRIASHYPSRFLKSYVRFKVAADPLYAAVERLLATSSLPLLDVGCGAGVLSFYLRESGFLPPIEGIDHDEAKVAVAREVAGRAYSGLTFRHADALVPLAFSGNVTLLDVLHYFPAAARKTILRNAIEATAPGGLVIIRECLREPTWRYWTTYAEETLAMALRWLKGGALNFPARDEIVEPFAARGFTGEVTPMWGATPYNNYLLVFRRER
jgi:2-polyprenyl-3-methyl-5-hydroxy-6-metoxy-1,4-benzoquinol methylase